MVEEPTARGRTVIFGMAKKLQLKRVVLLAMLLGVAFGGLGYRLVDLQVWRHDELRVEAAEFTSREILLEPRRGDILDARGNPLATSVFVKTVCADPTLVGNRQAEIARIIAPILELKEADVRDRLSPRFQVDDKGQIKFNQKGDPITNQYVRLKNKVTVETWQKVHVAMTNLAFHLAEQATNKAEKKFYREVLARAVAVEPVNDQLRIYPNRSLASHVLGFVGTEERTVNGKPVPECVGREGIEFWLNKYLAGARGWRSTETDHKSREVVTARDQDVSARDGLNVVLTIDSFLQHALESVLAEGMEKNAPQSISGLIVRPRTGEILALATLPDFNPNNPGASDAAARRNRVIADVMEPGSTFKIVPISGALNDQLVRLGDSFDCENGAFRFAGRTLHDTHSHRVMSVEEILTKSSNIGAAKIGIRLGEHRFYEYMRAYGFGSRTGIPLPGEVGGILHPVDRWSKVSIAQIPMGQGVAVTRLQMTMAMCAIANGGELMQPMLVNRLQDREGRVMAQYAPQAGRRVISETAAKQMVTALKTVTRNDGTGTKAALDHYTVAGKTGTAQKAGVGGYAPGKYISSFIGFFPADNPEVCISIVLDEPGKGYYGGDTAAPLFKQLAERAASYLSIPPDKAEEKPATAGTVANAPAAKTMVARNKQ